jgi:hypothetical protein
MPLPRGAPADAAADAAGTNLIPEGGIATLPAVVARRAARSSLPPPEGIAPATPALERDRSTRETLAGARLLGA